MKLIKILSIMIKLKKVNAIRTADTRNLVEKTWLYHKN